jgi:hypothetical protein
MAYQGYHTFHSLYLFSMVKQMKEDFLERQQEFYHLALSLVLRAAEIAGEDSIGDRCIEQGHVFYREMVLLRSDSTSPNDGQYAMQATPSR